MSRRRRTQSRNRRSGKAAPPVAAHLRAEDKALRAIGSSASERAGFFDAALRGLAELCERTKLELPEAVAARIDGGGSTCTCERPHRMRPRRGRSRRTRSSWSLASGAPPGGLDRMSPYPAMVTVGVDEEGATWFVDLEGAGVVQIVGDTAAGEDLARFIAAELALNPWSDFETVEVVGVAEDVVPLNYGRLYASPPRVIGAAREVRSADGRGDRSLRPQRPRISGDRLGRRRGSPCLPRHRRVSRSVTSSASIPWRCSTRWSGRRAGRRFVLVAVAAEPLDPRATTLDARPGGELVTPWGVVRPNRLTADEAAYSGQLFDDAESERRRHPDGCGRRRRADQGRPGRVHLSRNSRSRDADRRPGLDPAPPGQGVRRSGGDDGRGPRGAGARSAASEEAARSRPTPTLDQDLADWADPDSPRPKLSVLGPVELLRRRGEDQGGRAAAGLLRRTRGVPRLPPRRPDPEPGRGRLRDPEQHPAHAARPAPEVAGEEARNRSSGTYPPHSGFAASRSTGSRKCSCDADLFRRLRARGEALGPRGSTTSARRSSW